MLERQLIQCDGGHSHSFPQCSLNVYYVSFTVLALEYKCIPLGKREQNGSKEIRQLQTENWFLAYEKEQWELVNFK